MWITAILLRKNSLSTCGQTVHKHNEVINIIQFADRFAYLADVSIFTLTDY